MSHYKPYPAYKDSGVEWIGQIPEHWVRASIKHILEVPITDGPHETPVFTNEGIEFLSVDGIQEGELVFDGKRYISHDDHARFSKKSKPQLNDVLVGKSASVGKVARVKTSKDFNVWSPLAILRSDSEKCHPVYLELSLKAETAQQQIFLAGNTSTQANIGMDRLASVGITLPPIEEQIQLSKIVEQETTRIDTLISKKTRFIELLKEKRQALITHAVTKGLDHNVRMKDSGVEWIGEVPEHWEIVRIKRTATLRTDRCNDASDDSLYIGLEDVEPGSGQYRPTTGSSRQNEDSTVGIYGVGDVLYGKLRPYLRKAIVSNNQGICSTEFLVIQPLSVLAPWLHQWLLTTEVTQQIEAGCEGAKMPRADWAHVGSIHIPLPRTTEQAEIISDLSRETTRIDTMIAKTQCSIGLLKERRSALITAAVTGQIDLRENV